MTLFDLFNTQVSDFLQHVALVLEVTALTLISIDFRNYELDRSKADKFSYVSLASDVTPDRSNLMKCGILAAFIAILFEFYQLLTIYLSPSDHGTWQLVRMLPATHSMQNVGLIVSAIGIAILGISAIGRMPKEIAAQIAPYQNIDGDHVNASEPVIWALVRNRIDITVGSMFILVGILLQLMISMDFNFTRDASQIVLSVVTGLVVMYWIRLRKILCNRLYSSAMIRVRYIERHLADVHQTQRAIDAMNRSKEESLERAKKKQT